MTKITPLARTEISSAQTGLSQNQNKAQGANPEFEKKHPKKQYSDPLMQWPLRGLAFTNDIGAAVADIAPKAGMMLWIPALMYFGADIYDKYRNDKESYDPSSKRGLKQTCFQALASVVFPIAIVHAGQKTASVLSRKGKEGLSLQSKEEVVRHHLDHMAQFKLKDYQNNIQGYKTQYNEALDNMIDETMRKHKQKNPIKSFFGLIFGHKHPEEMGKDRRPKIHDFINSRIDDIFRMRQELLEGKKPTGMSDKLFKQFESLKLKYKKDPKYADQFDFHAAKDILKKFEADKIFKTKITKTIGGFVALALFIKPIDYLVEHIIMHKYIGPGIDKFGKKDVDNFKEKMLG